MRFDNLKPHEGQIKMVTLITGQQLCATVKTVLQDSVVLHKPLAFQIAMEPQDPNQPPHPQMNPIVQKLNAMPFGGPFIIPTEEQPFDIEHILAVNEVMGQMEKAYMQATSGIEIAGADALRGAPGLVGA